jgi:hypothetical protein
MINRLVHAREIKYEIALHFACGAVYARIYRCELEEPIANVIPVLLETP